uniref:Uncharacterized protein n=1 Tax=Attheya septentrionalis TaxID=420275 RepID=A0A7S2UCA2_9STRA|mmetsp:Transcript_16549/g.30108  ORF Transcript_16549/g.30108 Transcript_16549/m.30108 type:complete len:699 (+) Transcript_16549:110-2206(+)
MKFSDIDTTRRSNSNSFKLCLLALMVLQNSSIVLIVRYTRDSKNAADLYVVNHLILICEALKFFLSCALEYNVTNGQLYKSFKTNICDAPQDALKIIIPSLLYFVQNTLFYVALSNLSAILFQVTYQMKLLVTAVVSVIMLERKYSSKQWICLTTLGLGVAAVVLGVAEEEPLEESDKPEQSLFTGLAAVACACLCSAFAGVYFEKVLKKPASSDDEKSKALPVSLWMRNIQMAFFSVCIAYISKFGNYGINEVDSSKPFCHGFNIWVWAVVVLQAGGGLLIAAIIKYADNVLKGLATGVSVVTSTACSMILFGTPLTLPQFLIGAIVIFGSVFFFSNDIPSISHLGKGKAKRVGTLIFFVIMSVIALLHTSNFFSREEFLNSILRASPYALSVCLSDKMTHPVAKREIQERHFGLYPPVSSVRIMKDVVLEGINRTALGHLNTSVEAERIRTVPSRERCVRSPVPRKLHYVWVGGELPEKYVSNIEAMAKMNVGWEVFLWADHYSLSLEKQLANMTAKFQFRNVTNLLEQDAFINGDLYLREDNLAGKSGYLRLEAVYLEGGIYQDTDAHAVRPFDSVDDLFSWPFLSVDPFTYKNLYNCVFGFEQNSPFLHFAITLARENCLKFNTCGVMSGVGSSFVTAAMYIYDDPDIILIDQNFMIRQSPVTEAHITYHTMDGTWLEDYKKAQELKQKGEGEI